MIKSLIRNFVINVLALWLVTQYIGGVALSEGWKSLLIVSLGFTAVHLVVKPILGIILGVLNALTLGLVGLVIDSVILYGLTLYFPQISIHPWFFPGIIINGFVVPPVDFNVIGVTILAAFIINLIRSIILLLV